MSAYQFIVNSAIAPTTSTIVPTRLANPHHKDNQRNQSRLTLLRLCLVLLAFVIFLVGCGPEEGEADANLEAETIRIAQEYQQSGDLGGSRAQLEQLEVANPTQFLIFLAEKRADSDPGTAETAALVHFALALGLQSGQLMDYALAHGLLAKAEPPTPAVVAQPAAQSLAPVTSSEQTSATAAAPAADEAPNVPVAVIVDSTPGAANQEPAAAEEPAESAETLPTVTTDAGTTESAPGEAAAPEAAPVTSATATSAPVVSKPQVTASNGMNVRSGPGTAYPVVGALNGGEQTEIIGKNPEGDWWQISLPGGVTGWVFAQLVTTSGDTASVAVATNIPPAPPTATPAPIAEAPTAAPEQPPADQPPAEQPPAEQPPAEEPPAAEAPPPPATSGNDFIGIERRLWTVEETGGAVDSGGSVRCGEKRELVVVVLDANGNRLNGVAVQAIYGAQEIYVTGSQGKGDGQAEFVLGEGQGVKIIRDADGREVTSDVVDGMTTHSPKISIDDLIGAHYCRDQESCDKFNFSAGCWGHHSWTVTFKRNY